MIEWEVLTQLWMCVAQQGGQCGVCLQVQAWQLCRFSCAAPNAGSSSTVKTELFLFRLKSWGIALQIICACGEPESSCAVFAGRYLEICTWDRRLQLLPPEPLLCLCLDSCSALTPDFAPAIGLPPERCGCEEQLTKGR